MSSFADWYYIIASACILFGGFVGYIISFISLKSRFEEHLVSDATALNSIHDLIRNLRDDVRELRLIIIQNNRRTSMERGGQT